MLQHGSWLRHTGRPEDAVRALAWLGPREVAENIGAVKRRLSADDIRELAGVPRSNASIACRAR